MAQDEEEGSLADVTSALFALLTARLEDAAGIAGECQARLPRAELRRGIETLQSLLAEARTLRAALALLLREQNGQSDDVVDE